MSKKECKRVPSYAIRHLIQSLKEKGRTCRKGAEQRIDREILICDPEEEYVRRLAEALLLKKEVTAGVRICSSPEMVQELLKIGLIKVLLISEDVPYEKRKQIFTGKRIILTRQHCVDLGEEETELRKYQPVDGLMTGILKGLQEEKFPGSCADNGNGRILGVYSPVHRIGKTTFSLKLGKALAQSEDVLYLNLETYAGMGGYFRDQDAPDLANVLYYAKQERDDIGIRIASMVKRMGDLDYIPPMKVWTDLRAVHTEEWKTLFERLISQSVYSVIILDIGNGMEDVFQLLRLCDQILMPCAEDVYAMAKIAQYQHMLKVLRYQELESRTMYINMGKNMRQTVKETVELLKESTEKRFSMRRAEQLHEEILAQMDLSKEASDEELLELIHRILEEKSKEEFIPLGEKAILGRELFNAFRKLDILQELIEDEEITEIMINGTQPIFIERNGRIYETDKKFLSKGKLEDVVQQMVAGCNRVVNEATPIVDARLEDGSRVNVVLPPVALNGPIVTIRKFPKSRITMETMIDTGSIGKEAAAMLIQAVKAKYNIFISGGTGSGKTTFLNVLSDFIPKEERIITIEDSAELQITGIPNLVRLEARNANVEGTGEINIRDLIRTALRMRPERIIVGEVRGKEALDMLQAFICTI